VNYQNNHKILGAILLTAVILVGIGLIFRTQIYGILNSANLIPQPEHYTELYFNDFSDLQTSIAASNYYGEAIPFSFTIHNVEGKETTYPYVVYMMSQNNIITPIASSSVALSDGASITISEEVVFNRIVPTQAAIFVNLPEQNQSLHFFAPSKE
jgi:hypothetical protein